MMLKINVCNRERFAEVVNHCEGPVNLLISDGVYKDLRKNDYLQDVLSSIYENNMARIPLHIELSVTRDYMRFVYFMMSDC